ncbi:MAG: ParB/RepB/Spo0J family partition protein [Planctomycetaceae bacterium]
MDDHAVAQTDAQPRRRLGRGLTALLGGGRRMPLPVVEAEETASPADHIPVVEIDRNPFQPRKEFEPESLAELAASIEQHGLLQPLLVRATEDRYQLIAGERRWLAAQKAGLQSVPCRILELEDRQVYEVAIEENLKRRDLGVLEKAEAFRDYLQRFGCSIEELAGRLSMSRANVSNYLRLLDLSDAVKQALSEAQISNGHARALLTLGEADQVALCGRIVAESLSVRKTEQAVKEIQAARSQAANPDVIPLPHGEAPTSAPAPGLTSHVLSLQEQLRQMLGAKVEIQVKGKNAGRIVIPFASSDEFENLLRRLRRAA